MTRDWVLTLLAMSPLFLAGAIVILALLRKPDVVTTESRYGDRRNGAALER